MKELKKPFKKAAFAAVYPWMLGIIDNNYAVYLFAFIYHMTTFKDSYTWVKKSEQEGHLITKSFSDYLGIPVSKLEDAMKILILDELVICENDNEYVYFSVNMEKLREKIKKVGARL